MNKSNKFSIVCEYLPRQGTILYILLGRYILLLCKFLQEITLHCHSYTFKFLHGVKIIMKLHYFMYTAHGVYNKIVTTYNLLSPRLKVENNTLE